MMMTTMMLWKRKIVFREEKKFAMVVVATGEFDLLDMVVRRKMKC
jgi:hypothetical protein